MRFEKVSKSQYLKDVKSDYYRLNSGTYNMEDIHTVASVGGFSGFDTFYDNATLEEIIDNIYAGIKIPARGTKKSAGYDFYAPYDFRLGPGESIKIATGIKVFLDDDKVLVCAPRSGHGFKARIQLDNTIGIIDADYVDSDNEGHIMLKLTNDSREGKSIQVHKGDGMMQGIIMKYYAVEDDDADRQRNGGFGSTDNKE